MGSIDESSVDCKRGGQRVWRLPERSPNALLYDMTHDNPATVSQFPARVALTYAALVNIILISTVLEWNYWLFACLDYGF